MDASIVGWERWREQVKEFLPGIHSHQKKTLALFVIGIIRIAEAQCCNVWQKGSVSKASIPPT